MPPPTVVVVPTTGQPPQATAEPDPEPESGLPLFSVEHWSQLAIGIDEHWRCWALTPAPAAGDAFKKTDSRELDLSGDRWKVLLKLLAESTSGNCCDVDAAIRGFGYSSPKSTLPRDGRARQRSLQNEYTDDLSVQNSASLALLEKL